MIFVILLTTAPFSIKIFDTKKHAKSGFLTTKNTKHALILDFLHQVENFDTCTACGACDKYQVCTCVSSSHRVWFVCKTWAPGPGNQCLLLANFVTFPDEEVIFNDVTYFMTTPKIPKDLSCLSGCRLQNIVSLMTTFEMSVQCFSCSAVKQI